MKYVAVSALLIVGMAACAGPGALTPPKGLMYEMPETPSVVYVAESSQDVAVDIPSMGSMNVQGSSDATMALAFAPADEGVQVTVTFEKLTASLSNPMAGPMTATESDISGDLVFTIDERGHGTLVSAPEVTETAEQLVSPKAFAYEFFPRLPGGAVEPGEMWTDTTQYEMEAGGGQVSSKTVATYTLVGDTVVDGATLLLITYEGDAEVVGQAFQGGQEIIQAFSGSVDGIVLWDPARGIMVANESTSDMEGTTEIPATGMAPFPMSISATSSIHLQGG